MIFHSFWCEAMKLKKLNPFDIRDDSTPNWNYIEKDVLQQMGYLPTRQSSVHHSKTKQISKITKCMKKKFKFIQVNILNWNSACNVR